MERSGVPAVQIEQLPHLGVRDAALTICLDNEGFQRLARQFFGPGPKGVYERVGNRNFDCGSHNL